MNLGVDRFQVHPDSLRGFYKSVAASWGLGEQATDALIDHLLAADLMGVDSHGLQQLPGYAASMKNGRIRTGASPKIIREKGSLVHFDGLGALGQHAGRIAMQETISRAKQLGLAWVSVVNSNHYGMAGHYTRMAAWASASAKERGNPPNSCLESARVSRSSSFQVGEFMGARAIE